MIIGEVRSPVLLQVMPVLEELKQQKTKNQHLKYTKNEANVYGLGVISDLVFVALVELVPVLAGVFLVMVFRTQIHRRQISTMELPDGGE